MTKKSKQKLKYFENEKHFLSLLKGSKMQKIVSDSRVHL